MFKRWINILGKVRPETPPAPVCAAPEARGASQATAAPEEEPLEMTGEMLERLFPASPRMVSTIFERPAARQPPAPGPAVPPACN